VAAVVVVAVLGAVLDKWAFLSGLLVGLAVVVPFALFAYRRLYRILGSDPPEPSNEGPPGPGH
jgi:hypothetical protein